MTSTLRALRSGTKSTDPTTMRTTWNKDGPNGEPGSICDLNRGEGCNSGGCCINWSMKPGGAPDNTHKVCFRAGSALGARQRIP